MEFGTGIRDITPHRAVMLHGYAHRNRRSDGVAEPLRLGALALCDGQTRTIVITADILGVHTTEAGELARAVELATGVPASHVLVCASHTHFAPSMSTAQFSNHEVGYFIPEEPDAKRIREAAIEAAREALETCLPCRVETVRVETPGVSFNRRTVLPDGMVETSFMYPLQDGFTFAPVDTELTAVRFVSEAGTGAVLVNFGCHPVTGGHDRDGSSYKISSDYVHYLRSAVEGAWGYPAFFTLGAAGDAVPRDRYGDSRSRIGSVLGQSLVLAHRLFRPVDGPVAVERLTHPASTIVSYDAAQAAARYEEELAESRRRGENSPGFSTAVLARFRSSLYPDNNLDVPIAVLRIGPLAFVMLPFEVLSEFAIRMKRRYPQSVLVSCAGGYQGYLPFAYEYDRGGYEASELSTHFVPGTADEIYDLVETHLGGAVTRP